MRKFLLLVFCFFYFSVFSQTLNNSLTACYAFQQSAFEPINNLSGAVSNATLTADRFGYLQSAYALSGSATSYIQLPNNPLIQPANDITFSAWVKPAGNNPAQIVFTRNTATLNIEAYQLAIVSTTAGSVFRAGKANASNYDIATGTQTITANTWYHVAFTMDNTNIKLFVNGALQASTSVTFSGYDYQPGSSVFLGGSNDPLLNQPFDGTIDNVKFYNRALTNSEITQLFNVDPSCGLQLAPQCNEKYYAFDMITKGVWGCSWGIPIITSLTTLVTPSACVGLAVGPSLGFPAPNPTFWAESDGTYWYHNGYYFVDTGHSSQNNTGVGGSENFLYDIGGTNSIVTYSYSGTGNAGLLTGIASNPIGPFDVIGDDLDNLYVMRTQSPQSLNIYNSQGVPTCSYSLNGIPDYCCGVGFAMKQNTVVLHDINTYYVGLLSGSTINFTAVPFPLINISDFACCRVSTAFPSTISASPAATISCIIPTITLTANALLTQITYSWSGPGIISSIYNQTIQVNQPGQYSCLLTSCVGGTSFCTFNIVAGPFPTTPSISVTNSISCSSPSAQLSVFPNISTYSVQWSGYGFSGPVNSFAANVISGGIYTVALTNTLTTCVGIATINVLSTLQLITNSINICSGNTTILYGTGLESYSWSPGNFSGSQYNVSPSVTTVYTLTGWDAQGCLLYGMSPVFVTPTPSISFGVINPSLCVGNSISLNVTGASSFSWNPSGLSGASVSVSPDESTTYTVTGINGACTTLSTTLVIVDQGPALSPISDLFSICEGSTNTLTAANAVSYTWQPGSQNISMVTVSPSVTTIYTVSGTNSVGCIASSSINVIVNYNPTITISPLTSSVCLGSAKTLTANGGTNYSWGFNNMSVSPNATTIYSVVGYNVNCPGTGTAQVIVLQAPSLAASVSNSAICIGGANTVAVNGNAQTYTWMPSSQTVTSIIVTPSITTNYTVTGSSVLGCTTSVVVPVIVDTPSIITGPNGIGICPSGTLLIFASGATTYTWNPGFMIGSTTVVSPTITSTYTVLGRSVNGCTSTATRLVYVFPNANITVSASSQTLCSGSSATLSVTGASQYTWYPAGSFQNSFAVSPATNTDYTVTGINFDGCTDTKSISLTVNPMPLLTVSGSTNVICSGAAVSLSVTGANSYTWNPGGLPGSTVSVSPLISTTYTVNGSMANCIGSQLINISVNPNPVISVPNATLCIGTSTMLIANGANSYTWQPVNLSGQSINVAPNTTTEYTISGTNNFGCSSTTTASVVVNVTPTLTATASPTTICAGASVNLNAGGASTYSWSPGSLNTGSITVSPSASTIYSLVGSSSAGCKDTKTISVSVNANPVISVQGIKEIICSGTTITLIANGAATYTWNSVLISPSFTDAPLIATVYTITGNSLTGCVSSYTVMQQVSECIGIIETETHKENLVIYPNPTNGEFHVSLVGALQAGVSIEVYNSLGQLLLNQKSETSDSVIDLTNYANGTYLLLIHEKGKEPRRALIVKQ